MHINLDRYITVGKIGAAHGLDGSVKIISFTDNPQDIFTYSPWYLKQKSAWLETVFAHHSVQGKYLVARIANSTDRSHAEQWTNTEIAVKRRQFMTPEKNSYYWSDLEGMTVKTVNNAALGIVDHVMETGANPVLVVMDGKKRCLVPYVPSVIVKKIDTDSGELVVDWDADY
ncbi:MAG: ribosome maturation factor RimM [Gammaproteobacteria bacterium]|nr:ribosome maturation factor RimM [Gammaproteobacteria bacterium]MCD8524884.1 ribosome maturation factor RimM [Gammaproteobacteria bacterium]MCD8542961.1 ribosome maturation factor RimM [Gammaproteobacteria bacterium]